jgi:hypothetical protein
MGLLLPGLAADKNFQLRRFADRHQRIRWEGELNELLEEVVIIFTTYMPLVFIDLFYYQLDIHQAGKGYGFTHL